MTEPDALRVAVLLALQGVPADEIYERTGVSEDEVEDGLRRQPADVERVSVEIERQRSAARSDAQRRESAALPLPSDHVGASPQRNPKTNPRTATIST